MTGPFLYDDGPAPLHTGTPRRRRLWVAGGLIGIVLFALLMVGGLLLVKGTAGDQSRQVTGVFLAALANDDVQTAHALLCEEERARLAPDQVADEYLGAGTGEITGTEGDPGEGNRVQLVRVRWEDGETSEFSVISEDGPRVCGTG